MPSKPNPLTRGKKQKAMLLLKQGQLQEAGVLLSGICETDRRDAEAWYLLGAVHQHFGGLTEAQRCYERAVELEPDNAETYYYLGNVFRNQGDIEKAADCYRHAVTIMPDHVEAQCNLGAMYEQQKLYAEAAEHYRKALVLDAGRAELHYNMGTILQHLGRPSEARQHYRRAIVLNPNLAEAYNNLGNVLDKTTHRGEAETLYRQAIKLKPDYAEAHYNLGIAFREQGRLDEAITCYRRALELVPGYTDVHINLAFAYLLLGRFKEGWNEYQWRGDCVRPFPPSPWDGSDLKGRDIFLHAEQGLGDELFFLRFAGRLKARGAGRLSYLPSAKIASLLSRVPVIDALLPPDAVPQANEFVISVGDLPQLLGMSNIEEIPPALPLLPLDERLETMQRCLTALGPPPYVGITWRAGMRDKRGVLYKECLKEELAKILQGTHATVLVLQRQPAPGEIEAFSQALGRPAYDLSELNEDLEQMLALLALIDDYIGVSNTNMHLRAGAGKTARVLVPAPPEWRWMAKGKESPWFPGFEVYRQGYDGNWDEAFDMLVIDLKQTHGI